MLAGPPMITLCIAVLLCFTTACSGSVAADSLGGTDSIRTSPLHNASGSGSLALRDPHGAITLDRTFLRSLPVRGTSAYLSIFPDLFQLDGEMHVRGGRSRLIP